MHAQFTASVGEARGFGLELKLPRIVAHDADVCVVEAPLSLRLDLKAKPNPHFSPWVGASGS